MTMKFQTAIKASVIALVLLLTTGCAAELQNQIDALNAKVDSLSSDVARAQSAADAANASSSSLSFPGSTCLLQIVRP